MELHQRLGRVLDTSSAPEGGGHWDRLPRAALTAPSCRV